MAKDSKDTETHDFSKFTVAELKEELSARDLSLTGNKKDLIERLNEYEQTHNGSDNHIDDDIIEANSKEVEGNEEHDDGEEEMEEEHHPEDGEGSGNLQEIQSDDELDEVLGDSAREAFEEMRDDEYDEEQEYVTLDKVDDKDGEEPNSTESRGGEDEAGKDKTASGSDSKKDGDLAKVKKEEIDPADQLPVPPDQLHKWFFKQSSSAKKYSSLFVTDLTAKDILAPIIVEWSNRAAVFCLNFNRDGKGSAMMNFSSDKECKEAKDAITAALDDSVKIAHPSTSTENDIKDALNYRFDGIAALGQKWLTVEDAPANTSEDQINSLFPEGLLAFQPDMNTQAYNWEYKEYALPDKIQELFLVEFSNPKKASSAAADDKTYELDGVKLKVKLLSDYEDVYKKLHAKILNEKRDEKYEELEKKKKEELGTDIKLSNEERLQCYRDLEYTVNQRTKLTRNTTINWEEKMLEKQKFTSKVYDIVRKIDADTNRRVTEVEKFPEHSKIMTRHTKTEFLKLAPHERGTYEGKYEGSGSWKPSSSRGRGYSSTYGSSYRGRGRGVEGERYRGSSYRGGSRGGDSSYRGRGGYRGARGGGSSYYNKDSGSYSSYEPKRRRMDDYDSYSSDRRSGGRKEDPSVVTTALKSLTEVLSTKMDEMSRIAGGMKARERELEDAVHSLKRKGDRSPAVASSRGYEEGGYSSQRRGGGGRGSYSQSYSSYTSRGGGSSSGPGAHSRYSGGGGGESYSASSSSRYSSHHHPSHHDSYSGAERGHYSSNRDRSSGGGGGGGAYSSDRRSSTGYSGSRRGGGSSSYH